jgi:hypothetical protein
MSEFAAQGVDPTAVAKLMIGVGDGTAGGVGNLRIDNIRLVIAPPPANLLGHGDFEDGPSTPLNTWEPFVWSWYDNTGSGAAAEVVSEDPIEGNYCLHVVVPVAGANFWDVGLKQSGHVFEAGKSYSLSAWFKSKVGPLDINMKPERDESPYDGHGEKRITITDEWAQYTSNSDVIAETVAPAAITFHVSFAPGEFLMDDVVFAED